MTETDILIADFYARYYSPPVSIWSIRDNTIDSLYTIDYVDGNGLCKMTLFLPDSGTRNAHIVKNWGHSGWYDAFQLHIEFDLKKIFSITYTFKNERGEITSEEEFYKQFSDNF